MKLIEYSCPNCTATLHVDADNNEAVCEYCGSKFSIRDERRDAETEGYNFEMGRMKARGEMSGAQNAEQYYNPYPLKKRRTWLWVLGWILFFPIPLTVIIVRTEKLNTPVKAVLLILLWAFVFWAGMRDSRETGQSADTVTTAVEQSVRETVSV